MDATKYGRYFRVRETAAKALGKIGASNQAVIDPLIELLGDKDVHVTKAAIRSFEELHDPRVVPGLERVVQGDAQPDARVAARRAIFVIGEADERTAKGYKLQDEIEKRELTISARVAALESQVRKSGNGTQTHELT